MIRVKVHHNEFKSRDIVVRFLPPSFLASVFASDELRCSCFLIQPSSTNSCLTKKLYCARLSLPSRIFTPYWMSDILLYDAAQMVSPLELFHRVRDGLLEKGRLAAHVKTE